MEMFSGGLYFPAQFRAGILFPVLTCAFAVKN